MIDSAKKNARIRRWIFRSERLGLMRENDMRLNPTVTSIPRAYVYGNAFLAVVWGFSIVHDLVILMNHNGPYINLRWLSLNYAKHSIDTVSYLDVIVTGGFQLLVFATWWSSTIAFLRTTKSVRGRLIMLLLSAVIFLWLVGFGVRVYE